MTSRLHSRRTTLGLGGAATLALVGGILRPADADGGILPAGDAYAPWTLWNDPSLRQTPLALVAAAVLAANPHDTQPWLFRVRDDRIDVLADLSRNLGAMDPYLREMHLGLGCAIENLLVAAAPNGFDAEVEAVEGSLTAPAEGSAPAAAGSVRLTRRPPAAPDDLYRAIATRHTNRYAYRRERPLPPDWLESALGAGEDEDVRVFLFRDGEERGVFELAAVEATESIIADETMIADSDRWFRSSWAEIEAHRDGPTLEAAGLSFFALTYARLFPVSPETSHAAWLTNTRDVQLASAPVTGLIAVKDRYNRKTALAAGRVWQRLHLIATARGFAMQPINQAVEMADRERQTGQGDAWTERLAALTGSDWQATFAFRAGYPSRAAPPSPRRKLADVVMG
jgi:nitroreductase